MACKILMHKETGEEFLVPDCYSVIQYWGNETDLRKIIKEHCSCNRRKQEKYETLTRDEVLVSIDELKAKIIKLEYDLEIAKENLYGLQTEVFMLNVVEVYNPPNKKAKPI